MHNRPRITTPFYQTQWAAFLLVVSIGVLGPFSLPGSVSKLLAQGSNQDLPPETELPGQSEPIQTQSFQTDDSLPTEAELPHAGEGNPNTNQPGTQPNALPPESVLQREDRQGDQPDAAPELFDENTPGEQRPILRLNYAGHTGRIRALAMSQNSQRLFSAGEDKDLHVWQRDPRRRSRWIHQRTIRWQVWRGPRGWIYDLDAANGQVAMAGYGAMGGTGEIWIVDATTGKLTRPLVDYSRLHRQAVDSVAWSADPTPSLVSADLSGQIVHWQSDPVSGKWSGETIVADDQEVLGQDQAGQLQPFRRFHPVCFFGEQIAALKLNRMQQGAVTFPIWTVTLRKPQDGASVMELPTEIPGIVTQLTSSKDGLTLVAACYSTQEIKIWRRKQLTETPVVETRKIDGRPLFITLDDQTNRLMVGTEAGSATSATGQSITLKPQVLVIDLDADTSVKPQSIALNQTAAGGVFDSAEKQIILAIDNALQVYSLDSQTQPNAKSIQTLVAPTSGITRIAASRVDSPVKVAVSRRREADGSKPFEQVFDLSHLSLGQVSDDQQTEQDYLPAQRLDEQWTIRPSASDFNRFDLFRDDERVATLPFVAEKHGRPTTISTAASKSGVPLIIVGTEGQNNVYVFTLSERSNAADEGHSRLKLLRQFRGHAGAVRSTSATVDTRYLLTGSDDATLCVWNLDAVETSEASINRWGTQWTAEDGRFVVEKIDPAGPLYFRGVRLGDRLTQIRWPNENGIDQIANTIPEMTKTLAEVPFDTQMVFDFSRQGRALGTFQMFPAWYPLATVVMDQEREWAMWTPSGIYNASIAGNQRFGWQLNRGLSQDVDFFRADHFSAVLERPAVMRRLLARGSLAAAMQDTVGGAPPPSETAIANQIESRPSIEIVSPQPDAVVAGDTLEVVARIMSPAGIPLAMSKAFIDGIPGMQQSKGISKEIANLNSNRNQVELHWRFRLPRQPEMQLDVFAATSSQAAAQSSIRLRRDPASFQAVGSAAVENRTVGQPQLHLLAIGIGKYADPSITSLDFPARATATLDQTLRKHASGLYQVSSTQLVDREATRPLWRMFAQSALEQLREKVSPDDLVALYLCGHGTRDRRTNQWYFVTADADYRDLMNDEYEDCLSLSDLSLFAELPCRKLAILDSCHSGAVQISLREDDLKAAVRYLQGDVIMTLTASEGQEEAAEVIEEGLGRFTSRLIQALQGSADGNQDGQVTLGETVQFVSQTVAADSQRDGMAQHPTAGPRDLIDRVNLPLTIAEPATLPPSP